MKLRGEFNVIFFFYCSCDFQLKNEDCELRNELIIPLNNETHLCGTEMKPTLIFFY